MTKYGQQLLKSPLVSESKTGKANMIQTCDASQQEKSTSLIGLKNKNQDRKFSDKRNGILEEGGEFFSRDYQLERNNRR